MISSRHQHPGRFQLLSISRIVSSFAFVDSTFGPARHPDAGDRFRKRPNLAGNADRILLVKPDKGAINRNSEAASLSTIKLSRV